MDLAELWGLVKDESMGPKVGFVLVTLINHVEFLQAAEEEE